MSSSYDVIIVGAGIAGLMCAFDCIQAGLSVAVIHSKDISHSSSSYAQGGIAAAWLDNDSPDSHAVDTVAAGAGLCDQEVVRFFSQKGPETIQFLIDIGVPFDRIENGDLALAKEGAHSFHRIFHVKDFTGQAIITTLYDHLSTQPGIDWFQASLNGLVRQDSTHSVCGVMIDGQSIYAPHVVLATGGFSSLFGDSTNPSGNIGQGIALAAEVGASLGDLEFIQYHPTVFCKQGFPPLLISEALRGEGAFLVNKNMDRFMENYHPLTDLAPRDIVARAIANECEPALNIAPLMTQMSIRFPKIFNKLIERGFTSDDYLIPIQPLAHYTIGGIVADVNGVTNISGLYAIGECSVTGFHGANRLASNSLLEASVMGRQCAQFIVDVGSQDVDIMNVSTIELPELSDSDYALLSKVCKDALGVVRSNSQLLLAIQELSEHDQSDHILFKFVRLLMDSCYHRSESRGGHYIKDVPTQKDVPHHSVVKRHGEVMHQLSLRTH